MKVPNQSAGVVRGIASQLDEAIADGCSVTVCQLAEEEMPPLDPVPIDEECHLLCFRSNCSPLEAFGISKICYKCVWSCGGLKI
jgi:hypothetical protein